MKVPAKDKLWVFRMVHYQNVPHILENGMHCRSASYQNPGYISIGSTEVISRRDMVRVKCNPDCVVNDYVPFYFGVRTPMLYRIHTGYGVPRQSQADIVYLCCKFDALVTSGLEWCITDGNAASGITKFFTREDDYVTLDWTSIYAREWSDDNSDSDHDRMRKKHAEFLVKGHVPPDFIKRIVVMTEARQQEVQEWIDGTDLEITVFSNKPKFYF